MCKNVYTIFQAFYPISNEAFRSSGEAEIKTPGSIDIIRKQACFRLLSIRLAHRMARFLNLSNISHISIWNRAHYLENGKMIGQTVSHFLYFLFAFV